MLINGRENQRRDNSTKNMECMLREHSTLFHTWEEADTSTFSEETSSSRPEMVETPKNGTSINNPEPSNPDLITNHGILKIQERPEICKSGVPTQDGGRSSNTEETTLSIFRTRRFLMFSVEKMPKDKKLSSGEDTTEPTRDGELSTLTEPVKNKPEVTTETLASMSTEHSISDQDFQ
jgi:hypothetical protein